MDDETPNTSGRPAPTDLTREREQFVRNFLRKGVEFTEELLRENDELRQRVKLLEEDNAALRTQVKSDDAMRDVLRTIERLEQEKRALLDRSSQLEQLTRRHEGRYAAIEQELNDLANLYVASFQLHSTLSTANVLQHIKELLAQLVGAERFCVYVLSDDGTHAVPVGSEGLLEHELVPVRVGEGAVGTVCATGTSIVRQGDPLGEGSVQEPLAVLPMQVDGHTVGVISIVALLEQKHAWVQVDQELFHLLGSHAASALLAAHLYQKEPDLLSALAGLGDSLK
jgi:GAF domain-containing protein